MQQKVKLLVILEVLGLVGVYAYYKKIENDPVYRKKLFQNKSNILEGENSFVGVTYLRRTI